MYNDQIHAISQGDIFIIEPDAHHGYRVKENNHLVVYNVLFIPQWLKGDFTALFSMSSFLDFFYVEPFLRNETRFNTHLRLLAHEQQEMLSLLQQLQSEFTNKKLGYQILIKTHLIEMFVLLSRCYQRAQQPQGQVPDSDGKMMDFIQQFIRLHATQPLTLEQVSSMCHLSVPAFSAKFKKLTGQTFIEYRNEIRIAHARQLLEQTDHKIAHIAQESGFDDLSFFNKSFKKITRVTPRQYRNQKTHQK